MATPPFGAARIAALKENEQSGVLTLLKQWVDNPQFFCCISGTAVGVLKDPVCILESDRVVCTDEDVTLDFSRSWSPTDSLAGTAYTVHWGDGDTTNGNFPDPRNPAAETETHVGGYDAVGFYDIVLDITDTLGATSSCRIQVYAEICPPPPLLGPVPGEPVEGDAVVLGVCESNLPYTTNWPDTVFPEPTWNDANAPGGINAAYLSLMYRSALQPNQLFGVAGTKATGSHGFSGSTPVIAEYTPLNPLGGGGSWVTKFTADQVATELGYGGSYQKVRFTRIISGLRGDQEEWGWAVGVLATGTQFHTHLRYFCLHTRDAWDTIFHSEEIFDGHDEPMGSQMINQNTWEMGLAQDLHTNTLYVAIGFWNTATGGGKFSNLTLYSAPGGINWSVAHQDTTWDFWSPNVGGAVGFTTDVWIPYVDDQFQGGTVFWSGASHWNDLPTGRYYPGRIYKSTSYGASPARLDSDGSAVAENVPATPAARLMGSYNSADYVYSISALVGMWSNFGYHPTIFKWEYGVGWSTWDDEFSGPDVHAATGVWFRLMTPGVYDKLPTHIGWHSEPWEHWVTGEDKKKNDEVLWIMPVEY